MEPTQQDLQVYTARAQADKAISSLKGILMGINMDGLVHEKEVRELQLWAQTHNQLIGRNPFNEFMTLIEQTVSEQIPVQETIEDLYWLTQKYESDNYYYNAVTTDLQTLQGICHGILADGIIQEKEVVDLNKWLSDNEHLSSHYPYDEIRSLVLSVLADKIVDDEEKLVLKAYFNQFVQLQDKTTQSQIDIETAGLNISGHCAVDPQVDFDGKTFCITGIVQRGSRTALQGRIQDLGGISASTVSRNTDYLVVADNGNPAWAFSCYGRKVEKAINLRKEGHTILLIHEFDLWDIIDDL